MTVIVVLGIITAVFTFAWLLSGWLRDLKATVDRQNAEWLGTLPIWERDQVERAAETWRDTIRYRKAHRGR